MRKSLVLLPLLVCASPALAQQPASAPQVDPAMADRLADAMQALSKAVLDLQVGDLKAAAEGRQPTPAEKKLTVRDIAQRDGVDVQEQIAEAKPKLRQGVKALNEALPAIMQSLSQAQKSLERALANMPDPTYPKR